MTVTEALLEGLQVTVIGLAIVFAVLILLMLILMGMKYVFAREDKPQTVQTPVNSQTENVEEINTADDVDDEELIAVLTAAVAASLNTSTYNLQIKSYRRIGNSSPAWNQAGLRDTIDSRF